MTTKNKAINFVQKSHRHEKKVNQSSEKHWEEEKVSKSFAVFQYLLE